LKLAGSNLLEQSLTNFPL
jgi:hypothetical protein